MRFREENLASGLPSQSNNIMVEHFEREAFPEISLEVRLEEVISFLEEMPSMVQLNAPQLGEIVLLVLGVKNIVDSSCGEDDRRASDKLVVCAGDEGRVSRVESGHEVSRERKKRG